MAEILKVVPENAPAYDVMIGRGLISRAGTLIAERLGRRRIILIADEGAYALHHNDLLRGLAGHDILVTRLLPSGEGSKSLDVWGESMDHVLSAKPSRSDIVVAFGGGVCGDHAGFVAATLLRGIDFIQIPTTLLAMVDSSIGGKTGVNAATGKNLIGAFHHPRLVISDLDMLATLPERERKCGMAELVKHAVIDDADLFERLAAGQDPLDRLLVQSCAVKARIVAEDALEKTGRRALLNFGHTFAHALEADMGYDGRLLHGEAVSMGMVMALHLSQSLGMVGADTVDRVIRLFDRLGLRMNAGNLPFSDAKTLAERMQGDKKARGGRITFILLSDIGRAVSVEAPDPALVHQAIEKGRDMRGTR